MEVREPQTSVIGSGESPRSWGADQEKSGLWGRDCVAEQLNVAHAHLINKRMQFVFFLGIRRVLRISRLYFKLMSY